MHFYQSYPVFSNPWTVTEVVLALFMVVVLGVLAALFGSDRSDG